MMRNAAPAKREGRARAGNTIINASGCSPWTIPVAKVANPIFFFPKLGLSTDSYTFTSHSPLSKATRGVCICTSEASLIPMAPIISRVRPTTLVPQVRIISMWSWSFRIKNINPNRTWPASWPQPQRAPTAALSIRVRPIDNGAKAARWSGPDSVCKHPAKKPVQPLLRSSVWINFLPTAAAAGPPVFAAVSKVAKAAGAIAGWIKIKARAESVIRIRAGIAWDKKHEDFFFKIYLYSRISKEKI